MRYPDTRLSDLSDGVSFMRGGYGIITIIGAIVVIFVVLRVLGLV